MLTVSCTVLQLLRDLAESKAITHVLVNMLHHLNSTINEVTLGAAGAIETILYSFNEIRNSSNNKSFHR
jgi:hypothetical protein